MTDTTTTGGNTPADTTPAPPPTVAPQAPQIDEAAISKFLAPRLEEARRRERESFLKELGVDDPAKAKAAIEAARKAEEDAKSAAEKLGETNKTVAQLKQENAQLMEFNKERSERLMMGLTDEQRTHIEGAIKAAGGDPASPLSRLAMIEHMAPQWAAKAAAETPVVKKPETPAAGTAPATGGPPETTTSPPNHRETYATLRQSNPFAAAAYGLQHANEVFPKTD